MNILRKLILVFLIVLISIFISYFAKKNDAVIDLNLMFYTFNGIETWMAVLFSFLSGVVFIIVLFFFEVMKSNLNERKLKKMNTKLKKELAELRNKILKDINETEMEMEEAQEEIDKEEEKQLENLENKEEKEKKDEEKTDA